MKIFYKKVTTIILSMLMVMSVAIGCNTDNDGDSNVNNGVKKDITGVTFTDKTFAYDHTYKELLVEGDIPEGVTVTYTNNRHDYYGHYDATAFLSGEGYNDLTLNAKMSIVYDDKGKYDADKFLSKLESEGKSLVPVNDKSGEWFTENHNKGLFNDGSYSKPFLNANTMANCNNSIIGSSTTNFSVQPSDYNNPYTGNFTQENINVSYMPKNRISTELGNTKMPHYNGDTTLQSDGVLTIANNNNNQTNNSSKKPVIKLGVPMPSCTKQEFLEADYLDFSMYFDVEVYGPDESTAEVFFGSANSLGYIPVNEWTNFKLDLNICKLPRSNEMNNFVNKSGSKGIRDKEDFWDYICAGLPIFTVRTTLIHDSKSSLTYKIHFTEMHLRVEGLYEKEKYGDYDKTYLADLKETIYMSNRDAYRIKNVFTWYPSNGKESNQVIDVDDENGFPVAALRIPIKNKTLNNQTYITVNPTKTLHQIEKYDAVKVTMKIESENPFPYVVGIFPISKSSRNTTSPVEFATFSANKWVTFTIPIKHLVDAYPHLNMTGYYEVPSIAYTQIRHPLELFWISYKCTHRDDTSAMPTYAFNLGDANRYGALDALKPYGQYDYYPYQYEMTLYIRHFELIKYA